MYKVKAVVENALDSDLRGWQFKAASGHPNSGFHDFPKSFPANVGIVPFKEHGQFPLPSLSKQYEVVLQL